MPYDTINDLPDNIRKNLPIHAQEIFLETFNNAWDEYKDPAKRRDSASREEVTFRVAWAAVKNSYFKDSKSGKWIKK